MRTAILLSLFCVIFVGGLYAQIPPGGREFTGVDFQADLIAAGREITGIDFQADLISAGREITGVDFKADLISAGREFTGVNFTAVSAEPQKDQHPDPAIVDILTPTEIYLGKSAKIQVLMQNDTSVECRDCVVFLKAEDGYNDKANVSFGPKSKVRPVFSWAPKQEGRQALMASLECQGDAEPKNNEFSKIVKVTQRPIEEGAEVVTPTKQTNKNKMIEGLSEEEK